MLKDEALFPGNHIIMIEKQLKNSIQKQTRPIRIHQLIQRAPILDINSKKNMIQPKQIRLIFC